MCLAPQHVEEEASLFLHNAACNKVGIIVVELVLGSLIGGRSCLDGTKDFAVAKVEHDDRNAVTLEIVCKAAIPCLKYTTNPRMTTTVLLPEF